MRLPIQPEMIPDKAYFKIGEVCELTGLKSHTLRYWESEFSVIKPKRAGSQQRLYRKADVETIFKIKKLIHDDGLTIAGTKKYLSKQNDTQTFGDTKIDSNLIQTIKSELISIKEILD